MVCKLFQQQGSVEVEVDKFSGILLEYQYFSTMLKKMVERKTKDPVGRSICVIRFTEDLKKDTVYIKYNTATTLLNKRYGIPD